MNTGALLIQAGTSTGVQAAVGGVLYVNTTEVGVVGAGEDTLMSYSVPANTLATNNDSIWFEAWGRTAAFSSSFIVNIYFGGTLIAAKTISVTPIFTWRFIGRILRTGAATQKSIVSDLAINPSSIRATPAETLTGSVAITVKGQGGGTNDDVVCEGLIVGWDPNNT